MKQLNKLIVLAMLIFIPSNKTFANDIEVKNADGVTIYYNYINDSKELEVTNGYYKGNVNIPGEVTYMNRTRKVTSIGSRAFFDCSGLTSVNIPNSVTTIEYCAFIIEEIQAESIFYGVPDKRERAPCSIPLVEVHTFLIAK